MVDERLKRTRLRTDNVLKHAFTDEELEARKGDEAMRRKMQGAYGIKLLAFEVFVTRWPFRRFVEECKIDVSTLDAENYSKVWSDPSSLGVEGLEAEVDRLRDLRQIETRKALVEFDTKKIIFLNINGVLNATEELRDSHIRVDPSLMWRLRDLCVRANNVTIVLTTFWREFADYIAYVLNRFGISAPVVGTTSRPPTKRTIPPHLDGRRPKAFDIDDWIGNYCPYGTRYLIIDYCENAALTPHQLDRFVRTDPKKGLTTADVDCAVAILLNQGLWEEQDSSEEDEDEDY